MTEYVYIVDELDREIAKKERGEITNDDRWRIISVWIEDFDGNVLLQQRSLKKQLMPGVWTAATEGTVDYGDDYDETAKREVEEEIGLFNIDLEKTTKYIGKWGHKGSRACQGYKVIIDKNIKLTHQESEVQQIKWVSPSELKELMKDKAKFPLTEEYRALGFIS